MKVFSIACPPDRRSHPSVTGRHHVSATFHSVKKGVQVNTTVKIALGILLLPPTVAYAHDPGGWANESFYSLIIVLITDAVLISLSVYTLRRINRIKRKNPCIAFAVCMSLLVGVLEFYLLLHYWVFD